MTRYTMNYNCCQLIDGYIHNLLKYNWFMMEGFWGFGVLEHYGLNEQEKL